MNDYVENMWAIHGVHGLYTDTAHTRTEMIARHVNQLFIIPSPRFPTEKQAWAYCKKKGDKAVKVEIKYTA